MHKPLREPTVSSTAKMEAAVDEEKGFSYPLLALIFVAVMILLVNVGCAPQKPSQAAEPPRKPGTLLYRDDFSDPPSGWGIWTRDGASVAYHDDGLRILVNEPHYDFWSVAGQNFEDARIEVDTIRIGGPLDNDFGIVCRYQDKDNFYMLVISSDGYYGIAKMWQGQHSMIGAQQLQYTGSAIASDQVRNHLRADCVGSNLSLHVNGHKLMEAQDSAFRAGDVGVIAGAYDVQGVDILFDNFEVKEP